MRISLIAAAFVALPLLAACGSDQKSSEPQVTQADVANYMQSTGLRDPKLADCAAKHFMDSGISQEGLRLMFKSGNNKPPQSGDATEGLSKEDAAKAHDVGQKIATECINPS
ncbi:hypothetical protein [Nocardia transvalensis]|uniref:hypothetical protein n=1 Tax=Nocardia transvalensis TaxID=37333 RepID=UPI001894AA56|nr:hypothetical protein [Nocardia transvalensis]MBF6329008.1 hypothetical protein [Nocardia transvalensis]